jgi:hypothetical protein
MAIVGDAPAGSAFVLNSGVHLGFSVVPKSGDHFYAQVGAVLDGEHQVVSAFHITPRAIANDVVITGPSAESLLVIRNYGSNPQSQIGAVQPSTQVKGIVTRAAGWMLQFLDVEADSSRGLSLADSMTIANSHVEANGRLGIGGGGSGITIVNDVISDNGVEASRKGFEAGGIKTVGHDVDIRQDQLLDNGAAGVWTDSGASDVTVTDSILRGDQVGVQVEISEDVTVQQNTIDASQDQAVLVVASARVSVVDNTLSDNHGGIIVGGVRRTGPSGIALGAIEVNGNTVLNSGVTGVDQPLLPGMAVKFADDRYTNERFTWNGRRVTFAQWQALGQEAGGSSR